METVDTDVFWSRVVDAPDCFGELQATDAAWHERAVVVWRVVGGSLVVNGPPSLVVAWEENLGLEPAEGDALNARKAAVLRRLCDMGLPVTVACLEAALARRIGEGMAGVSLCGGTLTVSLALTATEAQIAAVEQLLGRVLPQALVKEVEWADGFPVNYTRLEYLESTGTQWMVTDFVPNNESGVMARYINNSGNSKHPISTKETVNGTKYGFSVATMRNKSTMTCLWGKQSDPANFQASTTAIIVGETNYLNSKEVRWKNTETNYNRICVIGREYVSPLPYTPTVPFHFCKDLWYESNVHFSGKLLEAKFSQGEQDACIFVPALDDTGAPCMYDLLARKACYNSGTGDFLYPGKEEATTYSLRRPLTYAQVTAHGIRRLYHVPRGYNGTREEYAAEHGYKVLVETPEPEEGYWSPVWHEREDCIELEWVESEPPAEEQ